MEFEKDKPASDADRRLAETKKLTLEPLHTDLAPDKEPDAAIVARHLTEGALPNAPNDTEQAQMAVKPSNGLLSPDNHSGTLRRGKVIIVVGTLLVVAGIIATAVIVSMQM